MRKRGEHHLLTADGGARAEPIVTYSRLSPAEASGTDGRIEPHFTAVRVDGRGRPVGAVRDEIDDLPLVDAPPSDVSLDPAAEVSAGEIREVRRRPGPRIAALAGAIAVIAAVGVLAATYSGVVTRDRSAAPQTVAAAGDDVGAGVSGSTVDATSRAIRQVSADQIPTYPSETAALAPRAAADPVAGEAALSDQATVSGEAALSAEPPGRVIVDPPEPRLRPATASFSPQQPATPPAEAMAGVAMGPPGPVEGVDVDSALAGVDRILLEQRAAAAGIHGTGDDEFYADLGPAPAGSVQPLPYPPLQPLPNAQQAYPLDSVGVGSEPYGPYYPGQEPYVVGQVYPAPPQLYPGVDLAAGQESAAPWWLPKRRALVIPNAPVPPAAIPNTAPGISGVW